MSRAVAGSVYLIATLDTKGVEADFLRQRLVARNVGVTMVDVGTGGTPQVAADVSRDEVFAAGGVAWHEFPHQHDRGRCVDQAAKGARLLVQQAERTGRLAGVISLGGSANATIGTAAMRTLPVGTPKIMISTMASGDTRGFVGTRDIAMLNAVVDIAGLNRISRTILDEAAGMMAGWLDSPHLDYQDQRPLVAATMFGVTTPCVEQARQLLEQAGYEVLIFHATGSGGETMEQLIRDGMIQGVLDVTTTELADELVGGVMSAGPTRLTAAAELGVPQVVSVGATDMVNFWAAETVPPQFRSRKLHRHNENVTLLRTDADECYAIGQRIGQRLQHPRSLARIMLPERGVSQLDREGGPFDDPAARAALFRGIRETAGGVPVQTLPQHINDPPFAAAAVDQLLQLMAARAS